MCFISRSTKSVTSKTCSISLVISKFPDVSKAVCIPYFFSSLKRLYTNKG